jgi:hypothetical protein
MSLRFLSIGALPLATLVGGAALAQPTQQVQTPEAAENENEYAVWVGYGDSDNIGRNTTPEPGAYTSVGLFAGLQRETRRLNAGLDSDLEYRSYSGEAYENETVGSLSALALVDMVIDRFAWNFEGSLSEGLQDPFAARGPDNRETIKVLTTGPRLDIPFGRTSLGISAMHSARRYDESSQVDNDHDLYEIQLSRQARPTTLVAFVASSSETEYVDDAALPYQIDQLFVRVDKTLRLGSLNADVGTNEISSGTQNRRDPLLDLSWTRMLGTRSIFGVSVGQEFAESGTYQGATGDALVTTDPFQQRSLDITYRLTGDRATASVSFGVGEQDYAGASTLDNDYQSTSMILYYRISPRIDIGLRYTRYDREALDGAVSFETQDDRNGGVWLNWTLGRRYSVAVNMSRYNATGNQAADEDRTEIRFSYSPTGSTSAALGSIGR